MQTPPAAKDNITLTGVKVNSADLVEGMLIKGALGRFFLRSHGIDLLKEEVTLNDVELEDSHMMVQLKD